MCEKMITGNRVPGEETCQEQIRFLTAAPSCNKARKGSHAGEQKHKSFGFPPPCEKGRATTSLSDPAECCALVVL